MPANPEPSPRGAAIFGFPLRGFGLLSSLLLSFAASLFTFCLTTCVAIFALIFWNFGGHHTVDFARTYRDIGLPAALVVLAIALPLFGALWIRAKITGAGAAETGSRGKPHNAA